MGVTYDHYRFKINLHNDKKYPFNLSDWNDIYLNPFKTSTVEGEITFRFGIDENDIRDLEYCPDN